MFRTVRNFMRETFSYLDCTGRLRKTNKISPLSLAERPAQMSSNRENEAEILKELKSLGIIQARRGGVRLDLMTSGMPRRLPPLSSIPKSGAGYNREEERIKAELRRQEVLQERGKMARESERKRIAAIERRNELVLQRIRKTKAKLRGMKEKR